MLKSACVTSCQYHNYEVMSTSYTHGGLAVSGKASCLTGYWGKGGGIPLDGTVVFYYNFDVNRVSFEMHVLMKRHCCVKDDNFIFTSCK